MTQHRWRWRERLKILSLQKAKVGVVGAELTILGKHRSSGFNLPKRPRTGIAIIAAKLWQHLNTSLVSTTTYPISPFLQVFLSSPILHDNQARSQQSSQHRLPSQASNQFPSTLHKTMSNDWLTSPQKPGLVNLATHSLYLRVSGPPRTSPTQPVVIICHGLGATPYEWVAVERLLSTFCRVYIYARAGYSLSSALPKDDYQPDLRTIAADLMQMLKVAGVAGPYVLVGHSYGGAIVRQFLADYGVDDQESSNGLVHGMVIVDFAPTVTKVPESWSTLLGDADYFNVVGVKANKALSDEEWEAMVREDAKNDDITAWEFRLNEEGREMLNPRLECRRALGDARLSVVFCDMSRDFRRVYEWGVEHGNGTEEAREALRKRLEDMAEVNERDMRENLTLSSRSRFVKMEGKAATHNVQVVAPELVVKEVAWVLGVDES